MGFLKKMLKKVLKYSLRGENKLILSLIVLGSVTWSLTMVRSGLCFPRDCSLGIGFWGANGHDGIWHLALASSLARGSFSVPTLAGFSLQNYHPGFDFLVALLHKITGISVLRLYFQLLPPVMSLLIGLLVYKLIFYVTQSSVKSFFAVFFTYFGGSFGYLFGKGESAFWAQQAVSTLINPPYALSLILVLLGLLNLAKLDEKYSPSRFWVCVVIFGLLSGVKAYGGSLSLIGLFSLSVWYILVKKKLLFFKVFVASSFIYLFVYFLVLGKPSFNMFVFEPFWFLESMFAASDRFYSPKLAEAMISYKTRGVVFKYILIYSFSFLVFLIGNLGTRVIGFLEIKRLFKPKESFDPWVVFAFSIILSGIILPTLFLQKGTAWNTIQFFYYSLFFMGILAGIWVGGVVEKHHLSIFLRLVSVFFLIILTIPTTIISLKDIYLTSQPPAFLPKEEIEALNFLKKLPEGVTLSYPFYPLDKSGFEGSEPLYLYDSTAYVSAFSNKTTFLEDENNMEIMGYNWKDRRSEVENWFIGKAFDSSISFLKNYKIKYIYLVDDQKLPFSQDALGLKLIFSNSKVSIYQVN